MSQYDKDDVEAIGLVKFDFLGLATSPSWRSPRNSSSSATGQEQFSYENIPLDDRATYRLFGWQDRGGVPV